VFIHLASGFVKSGLGSNDTIDHGDRQPEKGCSAKSSAIYIGLRFDAKLALCGTWADGGGNICAKPAWWDGAEECVNKKSQLFRVSFGFSVFHMVELTRHAARSGLVSLDMGV
jgi:hypothetical protein